MNRNLISISDLSTDDVWSLIDRAKELKKGEQSTPLSGRTLALLFRMPSLRTRVSFDAGMKQLGGHTIYLSPEEVGLGTREPIPDVAKVLSRYVDGIMIRTFRHSDVVTLAESSTVPVINGLTDQEHPCQVLADLLTIHEVKGDLSGLKIGYVGDGNNMATSLSMGAGLVGASISLATPEGYELDGPVLSRIESLFSRNGASIEITSDIRQAVSGADVVYTDVWTSMGQEEESERRRVDFAEYRVDPQLMAAAGKKAIFMHPLPAHPGEEIEEGMLDHSQSVVFDQAENRLHIQKAILAELLGRG